jgi:hypothetical protein
MMRSDEQESQVQMDYDVEEHFPSSPPERRQVGQTRKHNDEKVSDPIHHGEETQNDSLGSRVEETQFVALEHATQADDEPSFQDASKQSEMATAEMQASSIAHTLPQFTAIERPRVPDLVGSVAGFKFGRVQQAHLDFGINKGKAGKDNKRDEAQQQGRRTVGAKEDAPLPKPVPLPRSPTPKTPLPSQTRSQKRNTITKPFPEVSSSDQPPARRMKSISAPTQHASAASHPLQSLDVNRSTSTNQVSASHKTDVFTGQGNMSGQVQNATSASSHRQVLSPSHNNPINVQAAEMREKHQVGEPPGVQVNTMLPPPAALHHNDGPNEWAQVPPSGPPREQVLAPDHEDVDGEVSTFEAAHDSLTETALNGNWVDNESNNQFQPPSQPHSRPQSALSNTAKARAARSLTSDEPHTQGVTESVVLGNGHPMRVQKPAGGINRRAKSNQKASTQAQIPKLTADGLRAFQQFMPGIAEVLQECEDQKTILESQQAEIKKLNLSNNESKKQIENLNNDKVILTAKIKKFTEISAKYKAHMNDVVQAQKYLMAEQNEIRTQAATLHEQSKAALKVVANEDRLRQLIHIAREERPSAEKFKESKLSSCL